MPSTGDVLKEAITEVDVAAILAQAIVDKGNAEYPDPVLFAVLGFYSVEYFCA